MLRLGILASGRGSNMEAIIDATVAGRLVAQVAVVISDVAGAPALAKAAARGIEACHVDPAAFPRKSAYERRLFEILTEHGVGLVALAGYMRLVGRTLLEAYPGRIMNIHPSLLPAFPGLDAQAQALEYGVKVAGCTVHFVDEGTDSGPIILQAAVPVKEDDTAETLAARILVEEHRLYPRAIQLFAEGRLVLDGRRVRIEGGAGQWHPSGGHC